MPEAINTLTEREKETLRLLLRGHVAKTIARAQGVSVHTVNERLRDARRKLKVSSSRDAARLLSEAEDESPNSLVDKEIGVFRTDGERPNRRPMARYRLAWLGGGMLIMSMFIAVAMLSSALQIGTSSDIQGAASVPDAVPTDPLAVEAARNWVTLVDNAQWQRSWETAAILFKSQISADQWASAIQTVRQPIGAVASRTLQSATRTKSLPGAPAGDYVVMQFQTNFANKANAVETITVVHADSQWTVTGYFIR